jgi:hypothetical protein
VEKRENLFRMQIPDREIFSPVKKELDIHT